MSLWAWTHGPRPKTSDPLPVHPIETEAWKSHFVLSAYNRDELIRLRQSCFTTLLGLLEEEDQDQLTIRQQQIRTEREALVSRISKLNSALAPYRKLPAEILSYIFELTREGETLHLPVEHWESITCPPPSVKPECSLKLVCSYWHDIASKTPAIANDIWAAVSLDYNLIPGLSRGRYDRGPLEADRPKLRNHILKITDYAKEVLYRGARSLILTLETGLDPSDGYWEVIGDNEILYRLLVSGPPHLEDIQIIHYEVSQQFMNTLARIFPSLPCLLSLNIDVHISWDQVMPLLSGPLNHLTSFHIEWQDGTAPLLFSDDGMYTFLTCCPQLQECAVFISCIDHLLLASQEYDSILKLDYLRRFEFFRHSCLHKPSVCDPLALLRRLNLPSLRHLDIKIYRGEDGSTKVLQDFFERSQCDLRALFLNPEGECPTGLDWEALLPVCPASLATLSISDEIPPQVLNKIANKEYLPHLTDLDSEMQPKDDHCWETVQELLASRNRRNRNDNINNAS